MRLYSTGQAHLQHETMLYNTHFLSFQGFFSKIGIFYFILIFSDYLMHHLARQKSTFP